MSMTPRAMTVGSSPESCSLSATYTVLAALKKANGAKATDESSLVPLELQYPAVGPYHVECVYQLASSGGGLDDKHDVDFPCQQPERRTRDGGAHKTAGCCAPAPMSSLASSYVEEEFGTFPSRFRSLRSVFTHSLTILIWGLARAGMNVARHNLSPGNVISHDCAGIRDCASTLNRVHLVMKGMGGQPKQVQDAISFFADHQPMVKRVVFYCPLRQRRNGGKWTGPQGTGQ
ncbi:Uu.00g082520.m01.CDS01 [Anthostomella pinea]|uniref:Uu.00g082520.m01.CDS01 n=1 Tax=Anthostomella pinea TaxID=933095 RepID=A0AAI8YJE5_9PEZI|nr:Uu.00g082520.m01.CDS01 [Anthostomella pinea]